MVVVLVRHEDRVCRTPKGAFYVMCALPIDDADKFQTWMLREFDDNGETMMFAPGEPFYATPGRGRNEIRLAYTINAPDIERAIDILKAAVEAYNKMHDKNACVGYVLSLEGKRVYFSGDTGPTSDMSRLASEGLDLAFLPGDGIYTMTAEEAAECANLIGAKVTVPIHLKPVKPYGEAEAARFAKVAKGALLVRPGESVEL